VGEISYLFTSVLEPLLVIFLWTNIKRRIQCEHDSSHGNRRSYRMVPPSYKLVYKPH
jgi:hypothetical protein